MLLFYYDMVSKMIIVLVFESNINWFDICVVSCESYYKYCNVTCLMWDKFDKLNQCET